MMSRYIVVFYCLIAISFLPSPYALANDQAEHRVVVELFTSQGCYSCPPADEFLGDIAAKPGVIAFACHVTYWNYLGWRDTFSSSFCDQRQARYQRYMGRNNVYTPQMVVNGSYQGLGSDRRLMSAIIERLQQKPSMASITITSQGDQLHVDLPDIALTHPVQLWLLAVSGKQQLPIRRGENGGKTLNYYQPVLASQELGMWSGRGQQLNRTITPVDDVKQWVVLAQSASLGPIVAAGVVNAPK